MLVTIGVQACCVYIKYSQHNTITNDPLLYKSTIIIIKPIASYSRYTLSNC